MGTLTARGRLFVLAGLVVAGGGMTVGLRSLTSVGALLVVLPLAALLLATRRPELQITRSVLPRRVPVDQPSDVTLELRNVGERRTPVLRAEEELAYALGDRPRMVLPRQRPHEATGLTYRVRSHVRGRHRLGPLTVRVADPFGLAERSAVHPGAAELTVLPRIEPLVGGPSSRAGAGGEATLSRRISLVGEEDPSVREYRVGDDLRRIHWPSTARTGEMMVRQDEEPGHRRALVVIDDRAAAHAGAGSGGSFEWAVSATASVVHRLFAEQHEVHLATSTGPSGAAAPMETIDHALDVLADLQPVSSTLPTGLVGAVGDFHGSGSGLVVAVLGPLPDEACDQLGGRGGSCVAMVLDRAGYRGRGGETDEATTRTLARLGAAGWRTVRVRPGVRVADAWAQVVPSGVTT